MDEDNKLGYFFLGLGVGVAVGLLFAPKSGEETREFLRTKARDSKDYLVNRGEQLKEQAGDLVSRSKDAITKQREQLAAAIDAGKQAYRESVAAGD